MIDTACDLVSSLSLHNCHEWNSTLMWMVCVYSRSYRLLSTCTTCSQADEQCDLRCNSCFKALRNFCCSSCNIHQLSTKYHLQLGQWTVWPVACNSGFKVFCDFYWSSCNIHQLSPGSGISVWGARLHQVLPWGDQRRPQLCQAVFGETADVETTLTASGWSTEQLFLHCM